jgi:hypothetical protein
MSKPKYGQYLPAAAVLLFLFSFVTVAGTMALMDPNEGRSDILTIGADINISNRQMAPVQFQHDRHTRALDAQCEKCHDPAPEKNAGFIFKGMDDPDVQARMDLFHDQCITCHQQTTSPKKTGPLAAECRACHTAGPGTASDTPGAWMPLAFDRSLHYRHVSSAAIGTTVQGIDTNCNACHHSYNDTTRELYYEPGTEGACVYCHKPEPERLNPDSTDNGTGDGDMIRSARKAAHDSCVACHHDLAAKKIKTGPVECSGCHDAAAQAGIQTLTDVPRLQRNQPDIVLLTGWDSLGDDKDANARLIAAHMDPVAFNHVLHETANATCTACHHDSLDACITCHTPSGTDKGGHVKLADAMHRSDSSASCIGCHTAQTRTRDCAGCHAQMPAKALKDQPCAACHNVDVRNLPQQQLADQAAKADLAEQMLEQRAWTYEKVDLDQVPDIVTIGVLSNEYQPSRFPHRLVVEAVFEKADQNEMARAFHGQELTLCAGCHHNSPATLNPPKCASCHGIAPDLAADKPGLLGAYHGQCITCHQEMAVTSVLATDCIKCHEKK